MTSPPRAEAPAARPGSPLRLRSARLQVTLGITLISLLVLAAVVLVANQLLWLAAERSADQRISTELANFSAYASPSHPAPGPDPDDARSSDVATVRGYLAQQYPESEVLLVGTVPDTGAQFTLSRNPADTDPLFPPETRVHLQELGRDATEPSGALSRDVRWGRVVVDGPHGRSAMLVAVNVSVERAETQDVVGQLVLASTLGLVLTALAAWVLAGRMLVPVRRIREAADTISADDLSRRVPSGGPDEIAALAATVNAMLDRVESAYRTQREFLDDAGHELRTPLTVVQANLDLLPDEPEERADTLRIVQDELTRMTRMVEDLLTLARADRPDFLRPSPVDVQELVLDVEAKIEATADRAWDVRPDGSGVAVLDRQRITQALIQFCANAVRFTRPGDPIEIGCVVKEPGEPTVRPELPAGHVAPPAPGEERGRRILFWVRDSGPGVPPGEEEDVFLRFHTARGQLRDGRGGTGLGLAIVSTIARAHGGRTFAFNVRGGGAAFCIVVPFVTAEGDDGGGDDEDDGGRVILPGGRGGTP